MYCKVDYLIKNHVQMKIYNFPILFLTICLSNCFAQSFKEKINSVYSFKIADLSANDLGAKYKQLDFFWQELNADTATYLPLVRKELQNSGYSSYFYFDMSSYLEMQSTKEKDKHIIEKAIDHIQWAELGTWELIEKLRSFSLNGINVTGIAFQLLKQEKVKLVNPETKESFNQGKILTYLLLPLKPELYLEKMSNYFDGSTPESQRSIITLCWMTNTLFGDSQLKNISSTAKDIDVRSYANRLLNRFIPSEEELKPYVDLHEYERKQMVVSECNKAVFNWDDKSWDKLILYSKIMHHFEMKVES